MKQIQMKDNEISKPVDIEKLILEQEKRNANVQKFVKSWDTMFAQMMQRKNERKDSDTNIKNN